MKKPGLEDTGDGTWARTLRLEKSIYLGHAYPGNRAPRVLSCDGDCFTSAWFMATCAYVCFSKLIQIGTARINL